jgi:hypothetical protein
VHNVDEDPADLKHFGFLHRLGPRPFVVVATDGGNGSEGRELFQNGGMPNVTRVNDEIASAQERHCFRPQKTVRVRDKAYTWHTRGRNSCWIVRPDPGSGNSHANCLTHITHGRRGQRHSQLLSTHSRRSSLHWRHSPIRGPYGIQPARLPLQNEQEFGPLVGVSWKPCSRFNPHDLHLPTVRDRDVLYADPGRHCRWPPG